MNIKFKTLIFLFFVFSIFNCSFAHEFKKDEIKSIISKFILDNPQVIEKSLQNLNIKRSKKNFESVLTELKKIPNPKLKNANANITIYEFFDYNCGFCKKVFSDLMELTSEDNEIKVVFIELPVLGQSSLLASKAAYVAHKSGKYFEMHQQLINHRGMIDLNDIKLFAKQSNINSDLLIKDINEVSISFIEKNYLIAEKLKINGTPTFIIGNEVIQGAIDKATLKSLLSVY